MLDCAIIDHASPTLARLKLGNLFKGCLSANAASENLDLPPASLRFSSLP